MCTLVLPKACSSSSRLRIYWSRRNTTQPFRPIIGSQSSRRVTGLCSWRYGVSVGSRRVSRASRRGIWMVDIVYVFAFKISAGLLETSVGVVGSCRVEVR